jgi:hypothetical protein
MRLQLNTIENERNKLTAQLVSLEVIQVLFFVSGLIVASIALQAEPQQTNVPRSQTYCSRTQPGDSVAEVQWPLPQAPAGRAFTATLQQQVLDVTVYKDGFARGLYETVKPASASPEFHFFKQQEIRGLPGMKKLRVTQFATSKEQNKEGFQLLLRPAQRGQESADAKLEGLEPGMKYFVRLPSMIGEQKTVSFTAAVCPVDYIRPTKTK